ncbi:MAG TPA: AAA family ATPase [Alphaproteobacteria bacterium]|nr:AAA family ATPase [Alphaproteobacteria bacterium]HAJ45139.1 AAA family ATPase [Alphaproteobacteria bacterium]
MSRRVKRKRASVTGGPQGPFLREVLLMEERIPDPNAYPYNLPVVRQLSAWRLHPRVTFLIGENGSGKSTLLEAIAVAWGFNAEGGSKNFAFQTTDKITSGLHNALRLHRGIPRPWDGFFLRAESFFNLATKIDELDEEPAISSRIKDAYGGKSLHDQSHGESFLALFLNRFKGDALYILDEPEAALSPMRQMAFLTRLHSLVQENSQFVIATHSPILLAYPDAEIFQIAQDGRLELVDYKETAHYRVTRDFLNKPEAMLKILLATDGPDTDDE